MAGVDSPRLGCEVVPLRVHMIDSRRRRPFQFQTSTVLYGYFPGDPPDNLRWGFWR